jgi:hypothetical protein
MLVGIELGGVMRTEDGGVSFSDHRPEAARDVHCLAWHPSAAGRACEAGGDGAAWRSDGGRSWDRADAGRDRRAGLGDGTLLQSDDGGDSWDALGERIGRITALAVQ